MDYLVQLISSLTNDPQRFQLVLMIVVGSGVFVFGLGIMFLVAGVSDPVRRRLQGLVHPRAAKGDTTDRVARALEPLAPLILPSKDWERSRVQTVLVHAGYRQANAFVIYFALKSLFGLGLPVMLLIAAPFFPQFGLVEVLFAAGLLSFLGLMLPNLFLARKVRQRQRVLRNSFPDAIDLLVVCIEAGLGLNAALQRVAQEMRASHPELAEELALVTAEIRAGVDRVAALKHLGDRTGLEDINGFAALLSQTLRFGTSIADTLRIYSDEFRDKRMQRAEELAAKLGTKMIFPLVLCLFPGFFVVAIGPAIIRVIEAFSQMGG
jgi:tight adherence protein C